MTLNRAQLCLLRSLKTAGWPAELLGILLNRCGATPAEWQSLVLGALVELTKGRWLITPLGTRTYNQRPRTLYF
jgi:hypothetical protein